MGGWVSGRLGQWDLGQWQVGSMGGWVKKGLGEEGVG